MSFNANYYVWHTGSTYVLCQPPTLSCAQAVVQGILNTAIQVVFHSNIDNHSLIDWNKKYKKNNTAEGYVESTDIPPDRDILDLIRLAEIRTKYLHKLELKTLAYIQRFQGLYDDSTLYFIGSALSLSNPDLNKFDFAILEYANMLNIEPKNAYNHLKMKFDSYKMLKIKSYASYEKYRNEINNYIDKNDIKNIYKKFVYESYSSPSAI
jgi:hypothetical protein